MHRFKGKRILVAEDELLLSEFIKEDLEQQGAVVLGPTSTVTETLAIVRSVEDFDAAILDVNFSDGQIFDVADALVSQGRPFVFASSAERSAIPDRFSAVGLYLKPLDLSACLHYLFPTK